MGSTNAERQAKWRARHKERLKAAQAAYKAALHGTGEDAPVADHEMREAALRQEIEQLRAELAKAKAKAAPAADVHQLRAALDHLRRENEQLRARSRARFSDATLVELRTRAEALARKAVSGDGRAQGLLLDVTVGIGLFLEDRVKGFARLEKKLAKLEAHIATTAPTKAEARRAKIAALAERGATPGERDAAAGMLNRLGQRRSS